MADNTQNIINLGEIGLPEIPLVGCHRQTSAHDGLEEHVHAGAMEICYLASGSRTYHVDGRDYPFKGGEVFVTFPDEHHGSGDHIHGKGVLYWLQVILSPRPRTFLGLSAPDSRTLIDALLALPRRSFPGSRRIKYLVEQVLDLSLQKSEGLSRLTVINRLLELFLLVIASAESAVQKRLTPAIAEAVQMIRLNSERMIPLRELSSAAGLSESRFKVRFRHELGLPPGEYMLREKVARAEEELREGGLSVTEIAHRLGFSSSQYFATVFKRFTRRTPGEARRAGLS